MSKLNQDQELMSSILAKEWHTLYAEEIILVMNYAKEQQAKIDELQKLRGLDEIAINQIAHANQQWQLKCDELQKQIDEALVCVDQAKDGFYGFSCDGGDTDNLAKHLEKALRGASD